MKARNINNGNWKGGKPFKTVYGYIRVTTPYDHPWRRQSKNNGWYIFEHRLVMEKYLGRYLLPNEFVHHINGAKDDNRIENLIVLTKAQHNTEHFKSHLTKCSECNSPFFAKGLCKKHYHRQWARENRGYLSNRYKIK